MTESTAPSSTEQTHANMQTLLNGPATRPPLGVESNFDNPPNMDTTINIVLSICVVVSTLFMLARLYTKSLILRTIFYEDFLDLMTLAWVGLIGFLVPSIVSCKFGGGTHMWNVRLKDYFSLLYWLNIAGIIYEITVTLIKVSILLQIQSIFVPNRHVSFRLFATIQVALWINVAFYSVHTVFMIAMCVPRKKIWNPMMQGGHCFNFHAAYEATGIFNVISDFAILIIPMVPLWNLQMPRYKRLRISALFGTGICACITSIIRTRYTFKMVQSSDTSYYLIIFGLWTWAEITIGIIVGCLPVMPKFVHTLRSKIGTSPVSNSSTGSRPTQKISPKAFTLRHTVDDASSKGPFGKRSSGVSDSNLFTDSYERDSSKTSLAIPLGNVVSSDPRMKAATESPFAISGGPGIKREDLEYGR
ncbi:MAG: hypothetical protein Q9218_002918 [Villophora microphyllina]